MAEFFLIAGAHFLALISPGPDFVMTTSRTLTSGRRAGCFLAVGLGLGILGHSVFAILGLSYVIEHSIFAFTIIKVAGSLYLLWMAWHLIRSQKVDGADSSHLEATIVDSPLQNIKSGFLTNILNPKASLFFLAVFSQIVSPTTSLLIKSMYAGEMVVMTMLWFSLVAWTIDKNTIRRMYLSMKHWIDRTMGVVLAALGLKLLFTQKN